MNTSALFSVNGILFNNIDTYTITNPGLYYLEVVLNYAEGTPAGSSFGVSLNGSAAGAAPGGNADTIGPSVVTQVANYNLNDTVRIINVSGNSVSLAPFTGVNTAGHLSFFRFADGILS